MRNTHLGSFKTCTFYASGATLRAWSSSIAAEAILCAIITRPEHHQVAPSCASELHSGLEDSSIQGVNALQPEPVTSITRLVGPTWKRQPAAEVILHSVERAGAALTHVGLDLLSLLYPVPVIVGERCLLRQITPAGHLPATVVDGEEELAALRLDSGIRSSLRSARSPSPRLLRRPSCRWCCRFLASSRAVRSWMAGCQAQTCSVCWLVTDITSREE